jgi:hypothetical protein
MTCEGERNHYTMGIPFLKIQHGGHVAASDNCDSATKFRRRTMLTQPNQYRVAIPHGAVLTYLSNVISAQSCESHQASNRPVSCVSAFLVGLLSSWLHVPDDRSLHVHVSCASMRRGRRPSLGTKTFWWVLATVSEFYGEGSSVCVSGALGNDVVLECGCRQFPTPGFGGGDVTGATARMCFSLQ